MTSAQWPKDADHPVRTPITHQRVGDCLASDATTWFHWSDYLSAEGPVATEGLQSAPGPVKGGSSIGTYSGNHEY